MGCWAGSEGFSKTQAQQTTNITNICSRRPCPAHERQIAQAEVCGSLRRDWPRVRGQGILQTSRRNKAQDIHVFPKSFHVNTLPPRAGRCAIMGRTYVQRHPAQRWRLAGNRRRNIVRAISPLPERASNYFPPVDAGGLPALEVHHGRRRGRSPPRRLRHRVTYHMYT